MSTILEAEQENKSIPICSNSGTASERVQQNFAACRVRFKWLGTSKSLSHQQKTQVARSFDAEGDSISAGKKLIDTSHEAYRSLTSIRSHINSFWKNNSLPYPEPGLRLIRQDRLDEFNATLEGYRQQLQQAVGNISQKYDEIKSIARERLGSLYNEDDYPTSLHEMFDVAWDFPSVDAPDYLRQLNPELYEQQSRQVASRFSQAVEMAEQAFMEELDHLVNHLSERLAQSNDGKPKVFRDSAIENLNEFFARFRELNVNSNDQLDELVLRCQSVFQGVEPQNLRDNESLRRDISTRLSQVKDNLDQMLIDRPRRTILRPKHFDSDPTSEQF